MNLQGQWRTDIASASGSAFILEDSSQYWPQLSARRRVRFQNLLKRFVIFGHIVVAVLSWLILRDRYNSQLLYGCSQPDCRTPSCLTYRKRRAKGPFRPYTVLTARTLATFLASQDLPEKGLCPHLFSENADGPETILPLQGHSGKSSQLPNYSSKSKSKPSNSQNDPFVSDESPEKPDGRKDAEGTEAREKDHKSFTQSLFDTSVLRLLHSANRPRAIYPERNQLDPGGEISISALEKTKHTTETQLGAKDSLNDANLEVSLAAQAAKKPDNWIDSDASEIVKDPNGKMQSTYSSNMASDATSFTKNTINAPIHQIGKELEVLGQTSEAKNDIIYRAQHQAWIEMHSWTLHHMLEKTSYDVEMFKSILTISGQTLAYFSMKNVLSLWHGASYTDGPKDVAYLMQHFNRLTVPLNDSKTGPRGTQAFSCYVHFIRRSISYICNTPYALLRSFVEWKEKEDFCKTARSYPLQTIATIFECIRSLDDSLIMLSNLWTSVDNVYVRDINQVKRNESGAYPSEEIILTPAGPNQALSDTESAHVAKVTLAALVAHVRDISWNELEAIQQLRSRGQEVLAAISPEISNPTDRRFYDNVLKFSDLLENEVAISLTVRLAKAMASRRWTKGSTSIEYSYSTEQLEQDFHQSNFMTLVVRNIADQEGLQVKIHTDSCPPSLQGGLAERCTTRQIFQGQDQNSMGKRLIVEWMRTVILKEWDGKPEVPKCSAVGGALEFLKTMCKQSI